MNMISSNITVILVLISILILLALIFFMVLIFRKQKKVSEPKETPKKNKVILAFIIIGFFLIMIGGIGAAYYFTPSQDEIHQSVDKNYVPTKDGTQLNIKLDTNIDFIFEPSNDNKFHLIYDSYIYESSPDWEITETEEQLVIKIKTTPGVENYNFFTFYDFSSYRQARIQIPEGYQNISVNGSNANVNIWGLSGDTLSMDIPHGNWYAYDLTYQTLAIKASSGSIQLSSNIKTEKTTLSSKKGRIYVDELATKDLEVTSESGDIEITNTKASNSFKVTNQNGDTRFSYIKAAIVFEGQNGSLFLEDNTPQYDLTASLTNGDIKVSLLEEANNVAVTTHTVNGYVEIFDKDKKTLTLGDGAVKYNLETTNGDIELNHQVSY